MTGNALVGVVHVLCFPEMRLASFRINRVLAGFLAVIAVVIIAPAGASAAGPDFIDEIEINDDGLVEVTRAQTREIIQDARENAKAAGESLQFEARRLVVGFDLDATREQIEAVKGYLEATRVEDLGFANTRVFRIGRQGLSVADAAIHVSGMGGVRYAEPDWETEVQEVYPNDYRDRMWHLKDMSGNDIGAPKAWEVTTGDPDVIVGVVDSGLRVTHRDIKDQVWVNPGEGPEPDGIDNDGNGKVDDIHGWNYVAESSNIADDHHHGTHMSGVIGATGNNNMDAVGVGWDLTIMPVKVLDSNGKGVGSRTAQGMWYAVQHGAKIVNLSLGSYSFNSAQYDVVVSNPDVLFVASAGNDSTNDYRYPCAYGTSNLVCVAATWPSGVLADYSNYGMHVDVAAPGGVPGGSTTSILTIPHNSNLGTSSTSGTSAAAAVTSGAAALIKSAFPDWTPQQIKTRLIETVDKSDALTGKVKAGGIIDVGDAVDFEPPSITFTQVPGEFTNNPSPAFKFKADEDEVTFYCRFDDADWELCNGEFEASGLSDGVHSFSVIGRDDADNVSDPVTVDFTVDTVAPSATITEQPDTVVKDATASIEFEANEEQVTWQCRPNGLDVWLSCTSPWSVPRVQDGPVTVKVRARDLAGNFSDEETVSWIFDLETPETTITQRPPTRTNSTTATFAFSASEPATFQCRLDGGSWQTCSSPHQVQGLGEGEHQLDVRAIDAAENIEEEAETASWTIDVTAPSVTITTKPSAKSNSTQVAFGFTSNDPQASFQCRLGNGAWQACNTGKTYNVTTGSYTFQVRATDDVGNTSVPASHPFEIEQRAPSIQITSGPSGTITVRDVSFAYSSNRGVSFECSLDNAAFEECPAAGKTFKGLADGQHVFRVRTTDDVGNTSNVLTKTFTVQVPKPSEPGGTDTAPKPGSGSTSTTPGGGRNTVATICPPRIPKAKKPNTVVKIVKQPALKSTKTNAVWRFKGSSRYQLKLHINLITRIDDYGTIRGWRKLNKFRIVKKNRFTMKLKPGLYTAKVRAQFGGKWEKRWQVYSFAVCTNKEILTN